MEKNTKINKNLLSLNRWSWWVRHDETVHMMTPSSPSILFTSRIGWSGHKTRFFMINRMSSTTTCPYTIVYIYNINPEQWLLIQVETIKVYHVFFLYPPIKWMISYHFPCPISLGLRVRRRSWWPASRWPSVRPAPTSRVTGPPAAKWPARSMSRCRRKGLGMGWKPLGFWVDMKMTGGKIWKHCMKKLIFDLEIDGVWSLFGGSVLNGGCLVSPQALLAKISALRLQTSCTIVCSFSTTLPYQFWSR